MDISFLTEYLSPVIVGLCLCVGFIVKHWLPDVDNKIIPTVCAAVGVLLAVWIHWGNITPAVLLTGIFSGLAATGLHQAFRQFIGTAELQEDVMDGVAVESLDTMQLRAIALQMGLHPEAGATRKDLLDAIEAAAAALPDEYN